MRHLFASYGGGVVPNGVLCVQVGRIIPFLGWHDVFGVSLPSGLPASRSPTTSSQQSCHSSDIVVVSGVTQWMAFQEGCGAMLMWVFFVMRSHMACIGKAVTVCYPMSCSTPLMVADLLIVRRRWCAGWKRRCCGTTNHRL